VQIVAIPAENRCKKRPFSALIATIDIPDPTSPEAFDGKASGRRANLQQYRPIKGKWQFELSSNTR
jgi:hypothetical protein